jgi:hypothetical protein
MCQTGHPPALRKKAAGIFPAISDASRFRLTDQELALLAAEIRDAFKSRRLPTEDALVASEDDPESIDVKRDFFGKSWNEVQDRVIDHNYCSLPLLHLPAIATTCQRTCFIPRFVKSFPAL